jgi:hypothetical protein
VRLLGDGRLIRVRGPRRAVVHAESSGTRTTTAPATGLRLARRLSDHVLGLGPRRRLAAPALGALSGRNGR